jgi:hypothetical protein
MHLGLTLASVSFGVQRCLVTPLICFMVIVISFRYLVDASQIFLEILIF